VRLHLHATANNALHATPLALRARGSLASLGAHERGRYTPAPILRTRLAIVVCIFTIAMLQNELVFAAAPTSELEKRPDILPRLGEKEACPISLGTRGTVPLQPHIFGGALWFGAGPVYFALAWKASSDDGAIFALNAVPHDRGARRAKTPWVSSPSFSGPVLIRGRALDANGTPLRFDATGSGPESRLQLTAPNAPSSKLWSFWPSSMWVPGPGCYGVQIDILAGTDIVIFEAT